MTRSFWQIDLELDVFCIVQVMVTNVTSLLKTVKTVEDEAVRGTRALESTIEAISQEIKVTFGVDDDAKCHAADHW